MSFLRSAFGFMLAGAVTVACGGDDDDDKSSSGKGGKGGVSGKAGMGASGDSGDGTGGTGAKGGSESTGGTGGSKGGKGGKGGSGGAGGTTGGSAGAASGMGGTAGAPMCTRLVSWDTSLQTSGYSYSDPGWLTANSGLYWDAEGNPAGGSTRMVVPFSAEDQVIGLSVYRYIMNLSGLTIALRVKLRSGLTDDEDHPGSVRLVAMSGYNQVYAAGPSVELDSDEWITLRMEPDRPDYVDESIGVFNASDVRNIVVELRTGDDPGTTYGSADFLVDDLGTCQLPGGAGGAGGRGGNGGAGSGGEAAAGMGGTTAGSGGAGSGGDTSLGGMGGEGGA